MNFFKSISLLLIALLGALEGVSYVSVRTNYTLGNHYQLGNQLFCIATGLAYGWDHDMTPVFPFLDEPGANRTYNREHMLFRIDTVLPKKIRKTYYDMSWSYKPIPHFRKDVMLIGPFMSWKYFHHHRPEILKLFAPSEAIENYLYEKYEALIADPRTVAIHMRSSDKRTHPAIPFPGLGYFEKALCYFPDDSVFVVFSDRINWCKKHFPESFPDKHFIFIEGNDHIQDLFLLSKMRHHIISNSTFSWWGAYLHEGEHTVCVPEIWLAPIFGSVLEDICLPEWIVIPHDPFSTPYPIDMYWYDIKSQSVDNVSNDQ